MTKFRNTANGDDSISSVNKPVQLKIQQLSRLTQAAAFSAVLGLGGCGLGSNETSEAAYNTSQSDGGNIITSPVSDTIEIDNTLNPFDVPTSIDYGNLALDQGPESGSTTEANENDGQGISLFEGSCGYIDETPSQDFGNSLEQSRQLKILFDCIEKEFVSDTIVPLEEFVPRVREALKLYAPNLKLSLLTLEEDNQEDMHIIANLGFIAGSKLVVSEVFTPEGENNFLKIKPYDVLQNEGLMKAYAYFPHTIETAKVGSYLGSGGINNVGVLGFNHYGTAIVFTDRIEHHWENVKEIVAGIPYWEEYSLADYIENTIVHEASHSIMDNSFTIETIDPIDFFSEKYHKWFGTGSKRFHNSALNEFLSYSTALQSNNFNVLKLLRSTLTYLENNGGVFEYNPISGSGNASPHALTYSFFLDQLLLLPGVIDVLNERIAGDSPFNTREMIQEILQLIGPNEAQQLANMFQLKSDEILISFQQPTSRKKSIGTGEYLLSK